MEIQNYARVFRQGWWIILATAVLVTGLTAAYTFTRPHLYESQAKLFVSVPTADVQDLAQGNVFAQQAAQGYADVATTSIVLDSVRNNLSLNEDSSALADQVTASAPLQSNVITITVRDKSADRASAIAREVGARLSTVAAQLSTAQMDPKRPATSPVRITAIESATTPEAPASPRTPLYLLLGAFAGLVLGFMAAALYANRRRSTSRDVPGDTSTPQDLPTSTYFASGMAGTWQDADPSVASKRTKPKTSDSLSEVEATRTTSSSARQQ